MYARSVSLIAVATAAVALILTVPFCPPHCRPVAAAIAAGLVVIAVLWAYFNGRADYRRDARHTLDVSRLTHRRQHQPQTEREGGSALQ